MIARTWWTAPVLAAAVAGLSCGDEPKGGPTIDYAASGPIAGAAGLGSFTFGVSTAAMQIEEDQPQSDWHFYTAPTSEGGLGRGTPVGDAVRGVALAESDIGLIEELGLDAYRFNLSWPRIQPTLDGGYSESALQHYDRFLDALVAAGIKPVLTLHHFSSPIWVDDFRNVDASPCVPSPTDLCGWDNEAGADLIIAEMAEYAGMLAARYGDQVDEWGTLNEPVNYLIASYGSNTFPPGKGLLFTDADRLFVAMRNYLRAHVAMYDAIKAADVVDADGDGTAAWVGLSLNHMHWTAASGRSQSDAAIDLEAQRKIRYAYHHLFVETLRTGGFDSDLDGTADQTIPGIDPQSPPLDWLGVQYYARLGVTGGTQLSSTLTFAPCLPPILTTACFPVEDESKCVPTMRYEIYEPGLYEILAEYHTRYPGLPLTVTESGLATEVGRRRSEHIVRSLEQIERARAEGADVRGYYHWSLTDNFEWAEGYEPHFGLYRVDREDPAYPRTATEGALTLRAIASARRLTSSQRGRYGGLGPMTAENYDHLDVNPRTCR